MRGGGAPCSSPLTLHVFWHLPLFPIRPGESQGLRLHFGQHDKAAAGRAGGSVSVRGTGTWTRQHRFSGTVGRSAADASSSSSSSSLPPLRASPCPAAAGAPSGPGRREAPPGARGRESRRAVVGLQAAGAERRGEERRRRKTGGVGEEGATPGARSSSARGSARRQPGAPIHAERRSARERSAAAGAAGQGSHPRPPPPFLPPPPPPPFPRHKCGGAEPGPLAPDPWGGAPGARGPRGAPAKGGHRRGSRSQYGGGEMSDTPAHTRAHTHARTRLHSVIAPRPLVGRAAGPGLQPNPPALEQPDGPQPAAHPTAAPVCLPRDPRRSPVLLRAGSGNLGVWGTPALGTRCRLSAPEPERSARKLALCILALCVSFP